MKHLQSMTATLGLSLMTLLPALPGHSQAVNSPASANTPAVTPYSALPKKPTAGSYPVEYELMTWPEIYRAIHEDGKTTALVFNGGTEQRGPQGVSGAHTYVARALCKAIAEKLGNAIAAPVLPYSVNGETSEQIPGTIGVSSELFASINEEVAEQMIRNGFKNVVLMGDHGGGQRELGEVAQKLDAKYAAKGIHVVYADDVYTKAGEEFNKWLVANNLPVGSHASIKDTSELLYLEGDRQWIRKDQLATAVGGRSRRPDSPSAESQTPAPSGTVRAVRNGISGDARLSTPEIGKKISDIKLELAVSQIQSLLHESPEKPGG